ncbi:hypothetical protein EXW38_30230 (plasmid) [Bacillus mycoides]|nr:hypothetical protein EXW38_30230 [Bacillus mycoides]
MILFYLSSFCTRTFENFSLKNNHGQYLSVHYTSVCLTDKPDKNTIFPITIQKDKWNEWLAKWYSSK